MQCWINRVWKQSKKCSVTWCFKKNYSAVHSFVHVLMYWEERILLNTVIHEHMSSICCYSSTVHYYQNAQWTHIHHHHVKQQVECTHCTHYPRGKSLVFENIYRNHRNAATYLPCRGPGLIRCLVTSNYSRQSNTTYYN